MRYLTGVVSMGLVAARLAAAAAPTVSPLTVSVAVRYPTGEAVAGATVEARVPEAFATAGPCHPLLEAIPVAGPAAVNADGIAVLRLPGRGVWHLIVRSPDFAPTDAYAGVDGDAGALVILPELALVREDVPARLRVVDPDGKPLAGVSVLAAANRGAMGAVFPWTHPALRGRTDARGGWHLPVSEAAIALVVVQASQYEPWIGHLAAEEVQLRPAASARRRLRLLDDQGHALATARVWDAATCADLGAADAHGVLEVAAPWLAGRRLVVAAPDGRRWAASFAGAGENHGGTAQAPQGRSVSDGEAAAASRAGGAAASWRLPPPLAPLAGRLLAAASGAPVAGALVWNEEDPASWTRSDSGGRFLIPRPVADASIDLHVEAAGFLPFEDRLPLPDTAGAAGGTPGDWQVSLTRPFVVTGRVVDERGAPLASAEAVVVGAASFPRSRAESDAGGRFHLELWHGQDYRLRVSARGHAAAYLAVAAGQGEPQAAAPLPVVLCDEKMVPIQVTDEPGAPVAGALVAVEAAPADDENGDTGAVSPGPAGSRPTGSGAAPLRTRPEGTIELPAPPSTRLRLTVTAPGFAPRVVLWSAEDLTGADDAGQCNAARQTEAIVLNHSFSLQGTAVDSAGRPVAGAEVWDSPPRHLLATSDGAGHFAAAGVDALAPRPIRICKRGYDPVEMQGGHPPGPPGSPAAPAAGVRLTLPAAAQLEGYVRLADGRAAPGVQVSVVPEVGSPPPPQISPQPCPVIENGGSATTDERGHYLVTPLHAAQWYRVWADDPARGSAESRPQHLPEATSLVVPPLILGTRTRVTGRFHDAAGNAVQGEVIYGWDGSPDTPAMNVKTDEAGRFTLAPLRPGKAMLAAISAVDGSRVVRLIDVQAGDNTLDLALPPARWRRVTGHLLDARGAPAAGAILRLVDAVYRDRQAWMYTNPYGFFDFEMVSAGASELLVGETGERNVQPQLVPPGEDDLADVVLRLTAPAAAGDDEPGHGALGRGRGRREAPPAADRGPESPTAPAPRPGPGPALASAPPPHPQAAPHQDVQLTDARAVLQGTIRDLPPELMPLASVTLVGADDHLGDMTFPQQDGSFTLAAAPGHWRVMVVAPNVEVQREIEVPPGVHEFAVEVSAGLGSATLEGRLTGAADPTLLSVNIRHRDGLYQATASVDSSGAFHFAHLWPGDYQVTAVAMTTHGPVRAGAQRVKVGDGAAAATVVVTVDPSVHPIVPSELASIDD